MHKFFDQSAQNVPIFKIFPTSVESVGSGVGNGEGLNTGLVDDRVTVGCGEMVGHDVGNDDGIGIGNKNRYAGDFVGVGDGITRGDLVEIAIG